MKPRVIGIGWWISIGLLVVCSGLAVVLLERYSYYDYQQTRCGAGPYTFKVDLVGSFAEGQNDRKSPYYLRMELMTNGDKPQEPLQLTRLLLSSDGEPKSLLAGADSGAFSVGDGERASQVFLVPSIDLAYLDYVLLGSVGKAGSPGADAFSCKLERSESHEWRVPLLDAFLSV